MPEYKFHVPPALGQPNATYWRSLGLSTTAAWFVLTVRPRAGDGGSQTFLLAWDTDVADALSSLDADLAGLLFVAPHLRGSKRGWYSKPIAEVWEGVSPHDDSHACVILVDEDGVEYSGHFMERTRGLTRTRLVAKVRPSRPGKRRASN